MNRARPSRSVILRSIATKDLLSSMLPWVPEGKQILRSAQDDTAAAWYSHDDPRSASSYFGFFSSLGE